MSADVGAVAGAWEGRVDLPNDVRGALNRATMAAIDFGRYQSERHHDAYIAADRAVRVLLTAALTTGGRGGERDARGAETIDHINTAYDDVVSSLTRAVDVNRELRDGLSWALDLLDMYDTRLATIDGADRVYSPIHVAGKAKARAALDAENGSREGA